MQNKFITFITLLSFTFVTLFSPFPAPVKSALAQDTVNTGSLRLTTTTGASFSFQKDLMLGDTDPDVKELQKVLNSSPDTLVAVSGTGSNGLESTYFGNLTKSAVIKFQEKYKSEILIPYGLTAGSGYVGQATRAKLNSLIGYTGVTLPSTGLPQSRTGTETVSTTPSSSATMSTCQFVELLISIGAIVPAKANAARSAMGCTPPVTVVTPPPTSNSMSTCQFIELLIGIGAIVPAKADQARAATNCLVKTDAPYVDVKVNDSQGPISVLPGTQIKLSWHSENTKYCSDGLNQLPISGSVRLTANVSLSYPVSCVGNNGNSVVDSATVIVSNSTSTAATTSIQILASQILVGYNFAYFNATTSVPTKMIIAYTNQPNATSSVIVYESATTTAHVEKITNLLPSTTYYAQIAFVAGPTDAIMTEQLTFTTLAAPDTTAANGELTQRVLSSPTGNGIVTIPEADVLKTNTKMTLEAWVKPTSYSMIPGISSTTDQVIISKGNIGGNIAYALTVDNGKLVYSNNDASLWTCSPVVPLNVWTHVAVTVDESAANVSLYVNGLKQNSICQGAKGVFNKATQINKANAITEYVATTNTYSSDTNYSTGGWGETSSGYVTPSPSSDTVESLLPSNYNLTSNVYFGNFYPKYCVATSSQPNNNNGFIGLIDDVKIWNIARTADQVKTDSATTSATSTPITNPVQVTGLVGHWSFDDGKATDLTNNFNNGALKGDMEILDDQSALSPVIGSAFAMSGLEFSFPESCDSGLNNNEPAGYKINFKGGVKSVTQLDQYSYTVVLETCDNPTEDLVKSVQTIGKAPTRDASYYNGMGTISVIIEPSFGMKVPNVRDTIQGTATLYVSGSPEIMAKYQAIGADTVGYADDWQPQPTSCMKPPDSGGMQWQTIAMIAAVVVTAIVCTACTAALLSSSASFTVSVGAIELTAGQVFIASAAAGWTAGTIAEQ